MTISFEPSRNIELTGQPTKQYGSVQERQLVATKKFSNRNPSRTNRVSPPCASAQALVHSSHRVHDSRSNTNRLWALYKPWLTKLDLPVLNSLSRSESFSRRNRARSINLFLKSGFASAIFLSWELLIRTSSTWSSAVQVDVRTPASLPSRSKSAANSSW